MGINERNKILKDLEAAYLAAPDAFAAMRASDEILCCSEFDRLTINHRVYILAWVSGFESALWPCRGWAPQNRKEQSYDHLV